MKNTPQFLLLLLCFSKTSAQINESPIAPLPQDSSGVIKSLIDSLLSTNTESPPGEETEEYYSTAIPELKWPLTLINSSTYWDVTDLEPEQSVSNMTAAKNWLRGYLTEANNIFNIAAEAGWHYFTNFTEDNRGVLVDSEVVLAQFLKATAMQARQFDLRALQGNASMQRMLQMLSLEGLSALPPHNFTQFTDKQRELAEIFGSGSVCERGHSPPCTLRETEIRQILASSYDSSQLAYVWLAWHNQVGRQSRDPYLQMVDLSNYGAQLNGFSDAGELWRSPYEGTAPTLGEGPMFSLQTQLEHLYQSILPLYVQLHSYVRRSLAHMFPPNSVSELTSDGPIPAHILGSMEGDNWGNLYHATTPYPDIYFPDTSEPSVDPWAAGATYPVEDPMTTALRKNNYTVLKIFKQAESFYESLGFQALPESFWNESVLTRPWDRDVFCYPPAAFDLRNTEDYRVKVCAQISRDYFIEAHRLLGHTYYQREYRDLPLPFREGANPSMAKAISEALAMASANNGYLKSLNLATDMQEEFDYDEEELSMSQKTEINRLYSEALQFVAPLPFQLVVDFWRWGVFDGSINASAMNSAWWDMKQKYQGIKPLGDRTDEDFDPAGTSMIATQQFPAVRQFIGFVMQFQILKALCKYSGHTGTLNIQECNIHGSKQAGEKLRSLMEVGISEPWLKSFKRLTGQDYMDASALMEYFQPLKEWLEMRNSRAGAYVGWDGSGTPFNFTDVESDWSTDGSEPAGAAVNSNAVESVLPGRDAVAFPGEDCSGGKHCLQDSLCNGTHCVCAAGMVLWDQYCLPNDPNMKGFGDEDGTLIVIEEEKIETTPEPSEDDKDTYSKFKKDSGSRQTLSILVLVFSAFLTLLCF